MNCCGVPSTVFFQLCYRKGFLSLTSYGFP
nr:MAG TPA: hypothetical protein [Caudoviricetes sp.]